MEYLEVCYTINVFLIFSSKARRGVEEYAKKTLECATKEGFKKTQFDFEPPEDKSMKGGHRPIRNRMYWMASCFGIGTPCSSECEGIFNLYF